MMEKMQLMLVDDEERFLATTRKLLEKKGYEVMTAPGGIQALEMLRSRQVHVVILDVKMPELDGHETLLRIKREYPMTEVIMLTGHGTVESAVEGMKSGACDYLMKPADIDELIQKAKDAYARRVNVEEKIRVAMMRKLTGTAREILQDAE